MHSWGASRLPRTGSLDPFTQVLRLSSNHGYPSSSKRLERGFAYPSSTIVVLHPRTGVTFITITK